MLGGCIEVFDWLRGTELWPSLETWQDAILFLETSEDAPPPVNVKYMLRAFAALGILKRLSGLLFGRPGGGVPLEQFEEYDQVILKVVRDEEGLDDLPIITNMDFGHTDPMFVLPYGVQAEIDCNDPGKRCHRLRDTARKGNAEKATQGDILTVAVKLSCCSSNP